MSPPLVSVICLCYNHERFVAEAIESVINQTYPSVQLIVVDDHSRDGSIAAIKACLSGHPAPERIFLEANQGNCRAFNIAFARSTGDFIIDLSADDVLMPDRIEKGLKALQAAGNEVGVNFTDAQLIDENGQSTGFHSDRFPHQSVPQGDVYREVIARYFINSPSMMMRRQVIEKLGGYDESLAYEDFDFWVRSSRHFKYCYTAEPLVKRRMLKSSLGKRQHPKNQDLQWSTLRVCEKALSLNQSPGENQVLKKRIQYEMRRALIWGHLRLAGEYWKLWRRVPQS